MGAMKEIGYVMLYKNRNKRTGTIYYTLSYHPHRLAKHLGIWCKKNNPDGKYKSVELIHIHEGDGENYRTFKLKLHEYKFKSYTPFEGELNRFSFTQGFQHKCTSIVKKYGLEVGRHPLLVDGDGNLYIKFYTKPITPALESEIPNMEVVSTEMMDRMTEMEEKMEMTDKEIIVRAIWYKKQRSMKFVMLTQNKLEITGANGTRATRYYPKNDLREICRTFMKDRWMYGKDGFQFRWWSDGSQLRIWVQDEEIPAYSAEGYLTPEEAKKVGRWLRKCLN